MDVIYGVIFFDKLGANKPTPIPLFWSGLGWESWISYLCNSRFTGGH